jgi:drug/metabolite transporter (DMT)-like permease
MSTPPLVAAPPRITGLDLFLILLVTCSWGLNYPIMKFVVTKYPPSTFRALTFLLGTAVLGVYAWYRREPLHVPPEERWTTVRLSIPNMVLWHVGLVYGISLLNSGRAAIIGYTMPVWALMASVLLYRNPLTWRATLGVLCSITATVLLALDEMSHFAGQPLGLVFTFGAAISWGVGNAMMKHTRLSISSIALTFWSLAAGAVSFSILALLFERDAWHWPNVLQWLAIGYGGVMTFAVSYVAWFLVARKLTPVTSGLSIMLVPVIGVFGGHFFLGETIALTDVLALGFILSAMAIVLVPTRAAPAQASSS